MAMLLLEVFTPFFFRISFKFKKKGMEIVEGTDIRVAYKDALFGLQV